MARREGRGTAVLRKSLPVVGIGALLAAAYGLQAIAANSGPAGITAAPVSGRDLLNMQAACAAQYGPLAHPCRSLEVMRATQVGAINAPSPGAFVLPSIVGTGGITAIDRTGIGAAAAGAVCLVLIAPDGQPSSLTVGNCNAGLPVLCCATFGDSLFSDGFEANGGMP